MYIVEPIFYQYDKEELSERGLAVTRSPMDAYLIPYYLDFLMGGALAYEFLYFDPGGNQRYMSLSTYVLIAVLHAWWVLNPLACILRFYVARGISNKMKSRSKVGKVSSTGVTKPKAKSAAAKSASKSKSRAKSVPHMKK